MRNSKFKRYILLLLIIPLLVLLFVDISTSQSANQDRLQMMKELREQMREFHKSEILPDMKLWKEKLDVSMSEEDLLKLNELRERASEFKNKMQARVREHAKTMSESDRNQRELQRKRMRDQKRGMREFAGEIKPLAKEYRETLLEIGEEAKVKAEEWKKISEEIIENWKEKYSEELKQMKNSRMKRKFRNMKSLHKLHDMDMDLKKKIAAARFMLWSEECRNENNNIDQWFEYEAFEEMSIEATKPNPVNLNNFPNPFSDVTTISFTLDSKQNVKLTISDQLGNIIATLLDKELASGEHSVDFNANAGNFQELSSGTYFYKLESDNFNLTGKMVLER